MNAYTGRNSSLEVFRILATFLVLIVHWSGWFLGDAPNSLAWNQLLSNRGGVMLMRSFSVCCVNCFLLLSGFFGINLKIKSVINLWITLVSIFVPFYLIETLRTGDFSILDFARCFEGFSKSGYYIQNYFLLLFFSPALNCFIEKYRDKVAKWTIVFFLIEFWFFCIMRVETMGFDRGYSFIHFVLMYMIGRSINIHQDILHRIKKSIWICGYLICVLMLFILYSLGSGYSMGYCNPFVVFSAIFLFMPFTFQTFHNKYINYIASSTLAVYIMQCFYPARLLLETIDSKLFNTLHFGAYFFASATVMIVFFFFCVVYDKLRLKITVPIVNGIINIRFFKK